MELPVRQVDSAECGLPRGPREFTPRKRPSQRFVISRQAFASLPAALLAYAAMRCRGDDIGQLGFPASRPRSSRFCRVFGLALFLFANPSPAQLNHIEEAASLLSQGQADQAEAEARQALKNPSTRALALAMMGTIRVQQGQYGASENFLTQALALDPQLVGHGPLWGTLTCWKINPCSVCEMQRRTKSSEMDFNLGKLSSIEVRSISEPWFWKPGGLWPERKIRLRARESECLLQSQGRCRKCSAVCPRAARTRREV